MKRMKPGKATGPNDLEAKLWKSRCRYPAEWLTKLINQVISEKRAPGD